MLAEDYEELNSLIHDAKQYLEVATKSVTEYRDALRTAKREVHDATAALQHAVRVVKRTEQRLATAREQQQQFKDYLESLRKEKRAIRQRERRAQAAQD